MEQYPKKLPPQVDSRLRHSILEMPIEIRKASGIVIYGRRIKSLVFTTDLAIIKNCDADAVFAVYPFTPQQSISDAIIKASYIPVFCGVGGGTTQGLRTVSLAKDAEAQGAMGVVLNAPVSNLNLLAVSKAVDIPVIITVIDEATDIGQRIASGASILNVAGGANTPAIVRKIRNGDHPRRFADPRQRRGDDPLRRLRAVHYAAAAQGDCAAEKAMTRPEADDLFREYARSRDHAVMARLVEENLPLSQAVARKFQGQGVEKDDLEQVAAMALMQAIERFDPERGLQFSTFALPTIAGSVRNYLRDRGSTIRLTRSLREQLTKLRRVSDELTRKLQREPSMRELAEAMELPPEELLTLLDARRSAQTVSLDAETSDDAEAPRLETFLGRLDEGYEQVEQAQWLNWVYGQVTPTEKLLLQKRFEERLGQRETARALGVSQMQVSRMERRLLTRLREKMTTAVQ